MLETFSIPSRINNENPIAKAIIIAVLRI